MSFFGDQICVEQSKVEAGDAPFYGVASMRDGHFVFGRGDERVATLAPDQYKRAPFHGFNVHFRFRFYLQSTLAFQ